MARQVENDSSCVKSFNTGCAFFLIIWPVIQVVTYIAIAVVLFLPSTGKLIRMGVIGSIVLSMFIPLNFPFYCLCIWGVYLSCLTGEYDWIAVISILLGGIGILHDLLYFVIVPICNVFFMWRARKRLSNLCEAQGDECCLSGDCCDSVKIACSDTIKVNSLKDATVDVDKISVDQAIENVKEELKEDIEELKTKKIKTGLTLQEEKELAELEDTIEVLCTSDEDMEAKYSKNSLSE